MNKIQESLIKRFESHRVIFWYFGKQEETDFRDVIEFHV
jgi:hypothetical protein